MICMGGMKYGYDVAMLRWEDMGFAGIRVMGMHEGMWRGEWVRGVV